MTRRGNILYAQKLHIFNALTKLNFAYILNPTKSYKLMVDESLHGLYRKSGGIELLEIKILLSDFIIVMFA